MPPKTKQLAPGSLTYPITSCYRDRRTADFVVIPNTDVIVQNADGTLTEHLTKELHVFGGTASSSPASAMMDKHYWQFATDHEKWPYMFVLRSLFTMPGKTADQMILADDKAAEFWPV